MFPRLRDFGARPLGSFERAYQRVAKLIEEDRYGSIRDLAGGNKRTLLDRPKPVMETLATARLGH